VSCHGKTARPSANGQPVRAACPLLETAAQPRVTVRSRRSRAAERSACSSSLANPTATGPRTDPQPAAGPGDYSFRLAWPPAAPKDAGFELLRRERSGRPRDGRIRVVIEGRTSMSTVLGARRSPMSAWNSSAPCLPATPECGCQTAARPRPRANCGIPLPQQPLPTGLRDRKPAAARTTTKSNFAGRASWRWASPTR